MSADVADYLIRVLDVRCCDARNTYGVAQERRSRRRDLNWLYAGWLASEAEYGTRTSSIPSSTPKWRPTGLWTLGGTEITRAVAMASCAFSACAPASRLRSRPPSSTGSTCSW